MNGEESRELDALGRADGVSRRNFLKALGSSFAALAASGCGLRPPKEKILPLIDQQEGAAPGTTRWYASTCGACEAACGALVKSRDGRPIKLEGNPDHPLSRGGLCARGQASILDLYDSGRLRGPMIDGVPGSWDAIDRAVVQGLDRAAREGKAIRLVSRSLPYPSLRAAVALLLKRYPTARHVVYDSLPAEAVLEAHRRTHGRALLPHYRFERARAIVGFDADFLGTWLSPVEFTKAWAANRKPDNGGELMSWHAQFEARMSVTGANADLRVPIRPSEELAAAGALGRLVARGVSWSGPQPDTGRSSVDDGALRQAADMLLHRRKRSLVVSGSADADVQVAVNWINEMLGNYGTTVDLARPSFQRQGELGALDALIREMERGEVAALLVLAANPAQDQPRGAAFAAAMRKVPLTVALAERRDETASLARVLCAAPHALESWGDAEPVAGAVGVFQPLLSPLFDARPALESLLSWAGRPGPVYDFIRERWRAEVFPRQKEFGAFGAFWDEALRRGAVSTNGPAEAPKAFRAAALSALAGRRPGAGEGYELVAYPSVALGDGRQANNPWLQELPDPVTKATWGNVASFSPGDARRLGIAEGRMVRLSAGDAALELPAHVQPGQADGVVAAALGYGRTAAGPVAANFPTVKFLPVEREAPGGGDVRPLAGAPRVAVTTLAESVQLAKTQLFDSQEVPFTGEKREALREMSLGEYSKGRAAEGPAPAAENGLWPRHQYTGHKWGMAVNLTACTGCAGCVVACQAENNVPVVGRAEVRKSREMHWLRIDRYYGGPEGAASPDVAFQPMFCQQCDNAPCETVCPVLATVHSAEGLNMQVYNRCVGTRYCSNNCPYKVRRFNWFDYAHQDLVQNLALNPDVTVRTRGVMEKCTFCAQRIYSAEFEADAGGRSLKDGDIVPACAQSCPADAIVFGDLNDPDSRVSRMARENRSYRALSELGVGPSVFYRTKVRNRAA